MQIPTPKNPPWRYRISLRLLSPLLLGYTLWKAIKGGGKRYFCNRLGFYSTDASPVRANSNRLWVHAASVGEVITVLPLVKSWLATNKNGEILFTTGTPTGYEVLKKQSIHGIKHQYLPIDFPGACHRFFYQAKICQGWIVETEIWPWLYSHCQNKNITLTVVNGRLSDKTSNQSTGFLATSYSQALSNVRVLARTNEDANRFISLGANAEQVEIAGDLKYASGNIHADTTPFIHRPFVLAASTHADEELQIATAWKKRNHKKTLLVLAPRHPERGTIVFNELIKIGFNVALRSTGQTPNNDHDIFIVDTLGELPILYRHALATFVGGSLIERGGHNVIEPAQFACPTVVGQHTFNFSDMVARLEKHNAIESVLNADDVAAFLARACEGSITLKDMGHRAQALVNEDRQSTLDTYQNLLF